MHYNIINQVTIVRMQGKNKYSLHENLLTQIGMYKYKIFCLFEKIYKLKAFKTREQKI